MKIPVPNPPTLLPIIDAGNISWQGCVGAKGYQVERSPKESGPWQIVATNVDEAFTQYHPQFADETVPAGNWFYRVGAKNDSGMSEPSNVIGPVKTQSAMLVDELADFSKIKLHTGDWKFVNRDCRTAREDAHRAAGAAGDELVYELPSGIESFRMFAFFPKAESAVVFSISADGKAFEEIAARKESYFHGAGEYDYARPILFHADNIRGGKV